MESITPSALGAGFLAVATVFTVAVAYLRLMLNKEKTDTGHDSLAIRAKLMSIKNQVNDIHDWCEVTDSDGVKKIYSRRSHDEELRRLSDMMRDLTPAMLALANAVTRLREDL